MKHLTKKNKWECLLYSWAMALDTDPGLLIRIIGHDGSEVINREVEDPHGRRGFHVQEMILPTLLLSKTATPFQLLPVSQIVGENYALAQRDKLFGEVIANTAGVVTGVTTKGNHHAVAYELGRFYDPDGMSWAFSSQCGNYWFVPREAWIIR